MSISVNIPKGTRDFLPYEMNRRNYIFSIIKKVFEQYGYTPIETPAMENLSTLMGKYGEEGDKLLFKILNSGDFLSNVDIGNKNSQQLTPLLCEKGLRYDLTVPFARFIVQHYNEITFPFKRYQIQPVWRADKPQKGRYREFYQCDVDVVGSKSMLNEVELLQIEDEIFTRLGINVIIQINNRKILAGIAHYIQAEDKIIDITVAIDKLDKIGLEKVKQELKSKNISDSSIEKLQPVFDISGSNEDKINQLKIILANSPIGLEGIAEVEEILYYLSNIRLNNEVAIELTLARGLNYYTSTIIEVKAKDIAFGSLSGGGRYDDLTGIFGIPNIPGVGISFGADRIYDVLLQLNAFPDIINKSIQAMFVNFGTTESYHALPIIQELRSKGISAMLYPEKAKIGKQFSYANTYNIPYVVMIGEEEIKNQCLLVKDMQTGKQQNLNVSELVALLSSQT
ncbi:MAG TPA: histidine--tRNA ligase [Bacteroidales bacterium]|nr:histidine--tRNA ligase [Bacteroidales bacterium]HOR81074.1 histidine--tRNA ligase [Bacteroidales bacterium]HPJ91939.1 histidine--tRNA ligase [Bacteroidales bacterium]